MNFFERIKEWVFTKGWIRRDVSLYEAIAMMIGATIGAGILAIPFAISKVGLFLGILLILFVGGLTIGVNLLIGEVSARTTGSLQIVGLTKKYLGEKWGYIMTLLFYVQVFTIMTVFIIGMGGIFSEIFSGNILLWGIIVWVLGSLIVFKGLNAIKAAELVLTIMIILAVFIITGLSASHIQFENFAYSNWAAFFMPYGVILFALNGIGTIPAAYRVLHGKNEDFKKAIIVSTVTAMVVYIVFVSLVLGVNGQNVTEIATLGLGNVVGQKMFYVANGFAFLTMMTSFIMLGMQLRDSLQFDYDFSYKKASIFTLGVPLLIFLLGLRQFIAAINIVGGVFMSTQILLLIFVYWRARISGDVEPEKYNLHHSVLISMVVLFGFALGALYSIYIIF